MSDYVISGNNTDHPMSQTPSDSLWSSSFSFSFTLDSFNYIYSPCFFRIESVFVFSFFFLLAECMTPISFLSITAAVCATAATVHRFSDATKINTANDRVRKAKRKQQNAQRNIRKIKYTRVQSKRRCVLVYLIVHDSSKLHRSFLARYFCFFFLFLPYFCMVCSAGRLLRAVCVCVCATSYKHPTYIPFRDAAKGNETKTT